ncbi:glycerol-3-phosphate 1-O-acyltransferase PlsY [Silvibacterium sp.]|uniref:glycerol-3-phosphate 1-O-acyltransferase PlsY n=1 Tax=Silvibacterium sp. TaxID=1964179 RepID=UPI0039E3BEEE
MPVLTYALVSLAAYLLGSIPTGYILVRVFLKEDIRSKGSGNIGATNVIRSGGKKLGAATFLIDALKGFVAVAVAAKLAALPQLQPIPHQDAEALAALFAILGHVYTVWLGFKGGKGVATALGVFIALAPWAALVGLGVFLVAVILTRYVSLGSILAALVFPPAALLLPHAPRTPLLTGVIFFVPLLVILKHHQNIARLLKGTENKFGSKKKAGA